MARTRRYEPVWVIAQEPLIDTEPPAPPKITIAPKQTFTVSGEQGMTTQWRRTRDGDMTVQPREVVYTAAEVAMWPNREELKSLSDETLMRIHNAYRAEVVRRQRAKAKDSR